MVLPTGKKQRTLRVVENNALRIFERKIILRLYGPVMENNVWRIRYKKGINMLLKGKKN
jgi:hypothetical protein